MTEKETTAEQSSKRSSDWEREKMPVGRCYSLSFLLNDRLKDESVVRVAKGDGIEGWG